jgi:NodT family efflux transporter outer membrane factor (OMF) lipoprotein
MKYFFLLTFLFFTNCRYLPPIGEKYKKPETKMPAAWDSVKKDENSEFGEIEKNWWENFQDPILNKIIEQAVKNNHDFKIAQRRVVEARANVTTATSKLAPKVDATASAARKNNYIIPFAPNNHTIFNLFTAGFDASWELDLFGANYRSRQSAKALLEASDEAKNYILVSLIAEVVKNYSDLRAAQNELFLQKQIDAARVTILQLNEAKKSVGLLSDIDLGPIKIAMLDSKSDLLESEARAAIALYNLEFLLGKRPGEMKNFFGEIGAVPILRKGVIIDAPVSLLRNRPDIKQAEREFASATEMENYSVARIFPKISLSGFFGFYNTKSQNLLQSSSRVFAADSQITMPILDFGGIFAGMKIADERKKQALIIYEEKVNKALLDVESSMIGFVKESQKFDLIIQSGEVQKMVHKLNYGRQNSGLMAQVEYLQSQLNFLQSEKKLNAERLEFAKKTVALYKSLGGGWEVFSNSQKK